MAANHSCKTALLLDREGALARMKGNENLLKKLYGIFLSEAESAMARLGTELASKNQDTVHQLAHSLKGGANTIHASAVACLAAQIDELAKKGLMDKATELLSELAKGVEDTRRAILQAFPDLD